jgi:hypothetical protein
MGHRVMNEIGMWTLRVQDVTMTEAASRPSTLLGTAPSERSESKGRRSQVASRESQVASRESQVASRESQVASRESQGEAAPVS